MISVRLMSRRRPGKFAPLPIRSGRAVDPLMHLIGDARVVMLGEASYGSHEYYT